MDNDQSNYARKLCYWAAILFLLANLTGILLIGINAEIITANKQQMFNSHLNGLLGSFWLLGLAFSLQWVRLGKKSTNILLLAAGVAAYALWVLSVIKSFLNVEGTTVGGGLENDFIVAAYMLAVVIPTLISAFLWVRGLHAGT